MTARRYRTQRALRRWWLWLLPVVGLVELLGQWLCAGRAPRFEQYRLIADAVGALRQQGDLVVVAPQWAEPMARQALGDSLMPLADVARPDASGYRAAVEVSVLGARDPGLVRWSRVAERRVGPFVLRRLTNPAPRPSRFDFVDALGPKRVNVSLSSGQHCRWLERAPLSSGGLGGHPTFPHRRFQCRGGGYFNVGVTVIADEHFAPRRCLWAHPPATGGLQIVYRDVPLGEVLVGHGGMYWMVERERRGAPVELSVRVDGDEVGRYIHADGDGWSAFEMALGVHASERHASVQFTVSSPDNRRRHFCFEARTR